MINNRIDELTLQSLDHEGGFDRNRFAELIIAECADLFEVEWGDEKLSGNDVAHVVKKHFGIAKI
jgi:hypothetical protein